MDATTEAEPLWGRDLRYVLTMRLFERGPASVAELIDGIEGAGFQIGGRASKAVSDALRWEIARGRVVRVGRGRYAPGSMPKQTRSWIRARVRRLPRSPLA